MAEQNPLRHQVEQELQASDWFVKFKTWGIFLQNLKDKVPLTQLCQVRWITSSDEVVIHCPNPEIRTALERQSSQIQQLQGPAQRIIIRCSDYPELVL